MKSMSWESTHVKTVSSELLIGVLSPESQPLIVHFQGVALKIRIHYMCVHIYIYHVYMYIYYIYFRTLEYFR